MMPSSFRYFNKYDEASKNYKLIIVLYSDPLLCSISTSNDSNYVKFV